MGVLTYSQEFTSSVTPARMFKAIVLDSHNLTPKLVYEGIKSIDILEGDGGVASPIKYVKNKINEIDEKNYFFKYTMIDGDGLSDKVEFVVHEHKFEISGEEGVYKKTNNYQAKVDINKEEIKDAEEKAQRIFKIVEEHLIANLDLYA